MQETEKEIELEMNSVPKLVNELINGAAEESCSDIHLSPSQENVHVTGRKHGEVINYCVYSKILHDAVVSTLKALSGVRTDQVYSPLDGRFVTESNLDCRCGFVPTRCGIAVTIRFLHPLPVDTLEGIGFEMDDIAALRKSLECGGLVLVSGPTGSGKTTTLHVLIQEALRKNLRVIALEDPVERIYPGCVHSEIREDIGYGYETALQASLRHDPDVIVIGEIRNEATALIASQAALTGHTVLASIHAPDAVSTIARMIDLGVPPDMLRLSLKTVTHQRLIPERNEENEIKGRVLVYEMLACGPEEGSHIARPFNGESLRRHLASIGVKTLRDRWLDLVSMGRITLADAYAYASV